MRNSFALLLFLTFAIGCSENTPKATNATENVFNTQNLPTQVFEINAETDTMITGKNGTKININKNSFVDKNGNAITGKISFELKEAITLANMVIGNLTTTSNGKILQTGGMIYTNARANGADIFIAQDKTLEISVPCENKNDSMLLFDGEVNPENQSINWVNPKDMIEKNKTAIAPTTISRIRTSDVKQNKMPLLAMPKKPIEYSENTERLLSIKFETSKMFPELQQYQNVKFKVSEKSHFDVEDSKKTWYDVKLEKTNEEGVYKVTFEGVDKGKIITVNYLVSPAYEGNDYKKALAKYEDKFREYEKKKKEIEERKQAMLDALKYSNKNESDPELSYIYSIKNLGWSNIDRFAYLPKNELEFIVQIDNKNKDEHVFISLIFPKDKIIIHGYEKKDGTCGFSHNDAEPTNLPIGEEAIILATTYRNNVPYYDFKKIIIAQKQNVNLSLKETTKPALEAYVRKNI